MNRKILALLFTIALTFAAGAAQARNENTFDAPAGSGAGSRKQSDPATGGGPGQSAIPRCAVIAAAIVPGRINSKPSLTRPHRRGKLPGHRSLLRGPVGITAGAAGGGDGYPQPGQGVELSFLHLRRGLSGCEPLERLPVFLRLRWQTRHPDDARAWKTAHAVTALALAGDKEMKDGPDADSRHRHQLPRRLCRPALVQVAQPPDQDRTPYLLFARLGKPTGRTGSRWAETIFVPPSLLPVSFSTWHLEQADSRHSCF